MLDAGCWMLDAGSLLSKTVSRTADDVVSDRGIWALVAVFSNVQRHFPLLNGLFARFVSWTAIFGSGGTSTWKGLKSTHNPSVFSWARSPNDLFWTAVTPGRQWNPSLSECENEGSVLIAWFCAIDF